MLILTGQMWLVARTGVRTSIRAPAAPSVVSGLRGVHIPPPL
jgi:hypothetical protein